MTTYPHRYGDTDRDLEHYATACVASAAILRSEGHQLEAADLEAEARQARHQLDHREPDPAAAEPDPDDYGTGVVAMTARQLPGRDVTRLLADFGHDLPTTPAPPPTPREPRLYRRTPRRGPRQAGRGWAASPAAPVATWRMTSDQAPVLWPFIATPGLPPTGAQMGIDALSGGSFHADPFGWVLRRRGPGHQPQRHLLRQTRPRQVRHHQGVHPADDGLRLPLPDPGRPQGRVRTAVPVPRRRTHQPSAPDCPPGSTRWRSARSGQHWDTLDREATHARSAIIFSRWLSLIRGLVGSQRVGAHPVPFGPVEEQVVKAALRDLTGYGSGATTLTETTIPQLWNLLTTPTTDLVAAVPVRLHPALPGRDPAAARRPRPARRRRPGRPVRRPHHHHRGLGRPHPVPVPVPADAAG